MVQPWKKGRGKMGPLAPIIGCWRAEAETPMGPMACVRDYREFGDDYVRLEAEWIFRARTPAKASAKAKKGEQPQKPYREVCMFGPDKEGKLAFWSYTSDGKWNPTTGQERTWFESLNQRGQVIQVRPETGGPKTHYMFDDNGKYTGKW